MKERRKEMKALFRTNRVSIFLFELLYRIFTALAMGEFATHGLNFALARADFSYLTARNAAKFFTTPIAIVFVVLFLLLCAFFVCLEVCVLYTAYQAGMAGEKITTVQLLVYGMKNLIELFETKNVRVFWICLDYFIVTGGWIVVRLISHIHPLSYIVGELSLFPATKYAVGGLMVLLSLVLLLYLYVPSVAILRDIPFREAVRENRALLKNHLGSAALAAAIPAVLSWACYYVFQFVFKVLAALLIILLADRSVELALIFTFSRSIDIASLVLASVVGMCLGIGSLTFHLYKNQDAKYLWEIPVYHPNLSVRFRRFLSAVILTALVIVTALYMYGTVYKGTAKYGALLAPTLITSHRGNSHAAPENTLPALEAAIDELSDYVEIDVQMTKDGELVLFHDSTLTRITGEKGKIRDYTYGELLRMDFGAWFSDEFAGTRIPTFGEALEVCKGRINMNIEIKTANYNDQIVQCVIDQIKLHGMENQVVISSVNYKYLKEVKELNDKIPTGYILFAAYGNYFEDENLDFFSIRSSFVTASLVRSAHKYGKEVHAWTVNSKSELSRMKRLQVDNIITDRPVLAREMIYREKDTETIFEFISLALRE